MEYWNCTFPFVRMGRQRKREIKAQYYLFLLERFEGVLFWGFYYSTIVDIEVLMDMVHVILLVSS